MTYGPDGEGFTDYPDYGPPNPQTRRPRPVVRPEPYDPFGTRERDQSAADQQRYGSQPRARQQARPGGGQHDGGRQGAGRHGPDQYGGDQHARDPYRQTAQVPRYAQRPGATRVGGGGDEYPFDLRSPESVMRGGRTAEADGRTDDPSPERPPAAGARANRRKGKKVVPPHVRRRRKIARRGILAVFLLIIGYVGVTMYPYLTAPGTDRLNARVAEWGRDHHLGWAVTWLENATYTAPPTGGKLDAGELAQLQGATASEPPKAKVDLPANITPLAAGTVPGEGVWHPVTMNSTGVPIVEKAALRPDAKHTSNLAYVMWMNQKALSFGLHPGYQQPGGNWSTPDMIGPAQRPGLVATWNGGFKVKPNDALGGFYADGRTAASLVNGKAAEVFYKDGSLRVGMWGRDETMAPDVSGVRQNLSLLVDTGKVMVGPGDGSSAQWGVTIKNSYFIARSGVGMTAKGDIVYVSGRYLSVYTLAKLLQAAGAVDAMELDINPDWVSFMSYGGPDQANPTITKLWDFTQPANRYFQPSDRDFVSVYKR